METRGQSSIRRQKAIGFFAPFLAALFLLSCPPPFNKDMLLQVYDAVGPVIAIISPEDGSSCAKTVIVTGTVCDSSTETGEGGRIKSITYEIPGSDIEGTVTRAEDGSFSFQFSTIDLGPTFLLKVIAEDWNTNVAEISLNLKKITGDDIPSFSVEPGNRSVTLSWEAVPATLQYSLYYTPDGTLPSEGYGTHVTDVSSPCTLTGLRNGAPYVFLLRAHAEEGPDNWSGYDRAIPISAYTVVPVADPHYTEITLSWPGVDGAEGYVVFRSADDAGAAPVNISGDITETVFVDRNVEPGRHYYYRVAPASQTQTKSAPAWARMEHFPSADERAVGSLYTGASINRIAVEGDYAYLAAYSTGTHVVDISDPVHPHLVTTIATTDLVRDAAVQGEILCLATDNVGLVVLDVSNPASPVELSTYDGPVVIEVPRRVTIAGRYVYLGDTGSTNPGVHIIDILDPSDPQYINTLTTPGASYRAAISNDVAYIADYYDGMTAYNVANPASPTAAGSFTDIGCAFDIVASPGRVYIADYYNGMRIIDVSVSPFTEITSYDSDNTYGVGILGSIGCIADDVAGLIVLDLSRTPPALLGRFDSKGGTRSVGFSGHYACTSERYYGMQVINLLMPASPTPVATIPADGSSWVYHGIVHGDYLYTLQSDVGIQVIDVSDPENPVYIRSVALEGSAGKLYLHGDLLLVANWGTVYALDLSSPDDPTVRWSFPAIGQGVTARGDLVYIAGRDGGLIIVDISAPGQPEVVGVYKTFRAQDVALYGDLAVVADEQAGIKILDVSDPASIDLVHSFDDSNEWARDVAISGRYAYVAQSGKGLRILDLEDPLYSVEYTHPTADAQGVEVHGNYVYVADAGAALLILDNTNLGDSDPATPELLETAIDSPSAYGIAVSGEYVYKFRGFQGTEVVRTAE
ncbi:MAG: hypothetical protein JXB06_02685 [Spirochaetales bacterium]|nr:hypothetical protein [Spirochaetales bacterium]